MDFQLNDNEHPGEVLKAEATVKEKGNKVKNRVKILTTSVFARSTHTRAYR